MNPKTARSQVLGGVTFGIGMALMEETLYNPISRLPAMRNLADYHIASMADVPEIAVDFIDKPDPHISRIAARGVGEIGITGVAAAIANGIFNATGKRIREPYYSGKDRCLIGLRKGLVLLPSVALNV